MSPEEWLAAQSDKGLSPKDMSPEAWLASQPKEPEQSWYEKLGKQVARQVGLTARGAIGGVASTLDLPAAATSGVVRAANLLPGVNIPVPNPSPLRDLSERGFNAAGVAQPENAEERVVQGVVGGMSGAGGSASMAGQLARVASSPVVKAVAGQMAAAPTTQVISGGTAGGSAQTAAEMGGGPVAQTVAGLIGGTLPAAPTIVRNLARSSAADSGTRLAQVQANAKEAHDAGYVVPPSQVSPTMTNDTLSGWSGKKIEQKASLTNQETTNRLAKEDLGLPHDAVLDEKTLADVRKNAGAAYKRITDAKTPVPIDKEFEEKIKSLAGAGGFKADIQGKNPELDRIVDLLTGKKLKSTEAMSGMLGMKVPTNPEFSTTQIIEYVKELRKQATSNLKSIGDNAAKNHSVGMAQREAANALDDLLDRNLQHMHINKSEVADYRAARQLIAKAHDYENITNTTSGNVSARLAARLADKGKPLTGNFEKIAKFGAAFPQSAKNVDMLGNVTDSSALDFGLALATAGHGRPDVAGAILARPLARNVLLSKPYQAALFSPKESLPLSGLMQSFSSHPSPVPVSQLIEGTK